MSKSSVPSAPDIDALVKQAEEAAQMAYDLGQDQLAWAQEQYAHDSAITDQITAATLDAMDFSLQQAQETQARYEEVYQPIEDQMIAQAEQYATPEYKAQEMGRAAATTAQQIEESKQATTRGLQSYGVNPSAGKQLSTNTVANTLGGAATAAASNQAAEAVDAKSLALTSDVANMGMGYPTTSTAQLNASLGAAQGTSQATTQATQAATNSMLMPATYIQAGTEALNVAGTTANQGYQNEIAAYNAQVAASSGIGSALGTLAGAAIPLVPGYGAAGTVIQVAHEGGAIEAQGGGAIPVAASPSRGAVTDDVPIMGEAGEFMIPKRAVEWFGQKFFHDQIAKADKQKAEATGQQAAVPAGPSAPAGNSPQSTPRPVSAVNPAGNKPVDTTAFDFARQGAAYMQQRNQPQPARYQTGAGSPPVVASRAAPVAVSGQARVPLARPTIPTDMAAMPPGMAAGGAVAHYLPPGQPTTTAQRMRVPIRRPVAPRLSPTMRMPAPGPIPISPTASPMVRSIRGMAAGGPVTPEWVWDPNISQWVPTGPQAAAHAMTTYHDDVVPGAYGGVPVLQAPTSGAVDPAYLAVPEAAVPAAQVPVNMPVSNPVGKWVGYPGPTGARNGLWEANRPITPPGSPDFGMSGSAYAGGGAGYGTSGARDFPVGSYPPQIGYSYPPSPNAPNIGRPLPSMPPGTPLTDSEVALVRRAITGGAQGKTKGGAGSGGGSSKGGSTARTPKSRPEKKRPIIVETPPYSMTAAEFARQGQAYLRGKPYTATPALPSARSK